MRSVLGLMVLGCASVFATSGEPVPKADKGQEVLKKLEGRWTMKSATAATSECIITSVFDNPTVTKPGLMVANGILDMTMKDEPIPGGRSKLEIGSDPEHLLMSSIVEPGETAKVYKCRFKVEGDTLILVQDFLRLDQYPESFDPKKGRDHGRAVTTFVREKPKP